tara:strand:+ start:11 stop:214 length:204 start_codon:yes stop_codon:yes gene_type:complete
LAITKFVCTWRHNGVKKEMVKNPTLVKNMKHVKWKEIPPLKGPNPEGLIKDKKQDKKKQENLNGRNR